MDDLAEIIKKEYNTGVLPVKVAFEDCDMVCAISNNWEFTGRPAGEGWRNVVLDAFENAGLPPGWLTGEPNPKKEKGVYSRILVYDLNQNKKP